VDLQRVPERHQERGQGFRQHRGPAFPWRRHLGLQFPGMVHRRHCRNFCRSCGEILATSKGNLRRFITSQPTKTKPQHMNAIVLLHWPYKTTYLSKITLYKK
jgi:hypothetical protein